MKKSIVKIQKMDCPSEVKIIESLIEKISTDIKAEFDLEKRVVTFYHDVASEMILNELKNVSLSGELVSSVSISENDIPYIGPSVEARTLKYLLGINLTMFIVEIFVGIYAESTGLIADGLDMLADSFVYGISLYAVGKSIVTKNRTAFLSGIMQISLGVLCLVEVGRKFYLGSEPLSNYMIIISIIALIANVLCLVLIHKHKDGEVHMKASWIFSANDVIVNTGVIVSGVLVYYLNSNIPDLVIGAFVSFIVIKGGFTIIKLSRPQKKVEGKDKPCCSNSCD